VGDIKQKFGTGNQAITCTVASLGSTSSRESTVVDNTTDLFMDVIVTAKLKSNAAGTSSTGFVNVYAYATADGGTTYTSGATGSDAAYSGEKTNLAFLGAITMNANGTTFTGTFNLARAFGYGGIPAKWGLVIENQSGAALDSTGGNHSLHYQGILAQSA
jgi:hypothetical protein